MINRDWKCVTSSPSGMAKWLSAVHHPVVCFFDPETANTIMPTIPRFIQDRLRERPPLNCGVVPDSTPVISFGNPETARVATLGLNPSKNEFLDDSGEFLAESERRFETLKSLRRKSLEEADYATLKVVVESGNAYFQRNPYEKWFRPLDEIVQKAGASFFEGTACHLDLVQWATDPVWRKLSRANRRDLLERDVGFLMQQLRYYPFEVLLLNGRGVMTAFQRLAEFAFEHSRRLSGPSHAPATLSYGRWESRLMVIGWSCNLQSSHGVTKELRGEIAKSVEKIVGGNA